MTKHHTKGKRENNDRSRNRKRSYKEQTSEQKKERLKYTPYRTDYFQTVRLCASIF